MQTTAIRTVANPLPENEIILLTLLISKRYIPYTDLQKIVVTTVTREYKKNRSCLMFMFEIASVFCDPAGARTQDPNIKSVVLYLLSY